MRSAVGRQMRIEFDENDTDNELVERAAMAYEMAAIEGLDALLHPASNGERVRLRLQAQAGAFQAYGLRRTLPVPMAAEARMLHILHLSALAYCGDQWTDLRRWLKDHEQDVQPPSAADANWEDQLLIRLFDCWVRLMRKRGWDDLDGVRTIIAGLREDQGRYESGMLAKADSATQAAALRLVAMYHWAKATELLSVYMLQGQPVGIEAGRLSRSL
jgi:hypothetical protein